LRFPQSFTYYVLLFNTLALVLAPYFVVWEVLFFLGYRPQLKKELDVLVQADIAAFRARKALGSKQKPQ
jgi:uncharacterized membrane protein YGL010W